MYSEVLTTAWEQMEANADISPFSSVCSVLVNICVAGRSRDRVGKKSDRLNVTDRNTLNTTDGEQRYKSESVKTFQTKTLNSEVTFKLQAKTRCVSLLESHQRVLTSVW